MAVGRVAGKFVGREFDLLLGDSGLLASPSLIGDGRGDGRGDGSRLGSYCFGGDVRECVSLKIKRWQ